VIDAFDLTTRIAELQAANLRPCDWTDLLRLKDGGAMDAGDEQALNDYLGHFLPPSDKCVSCGAVQAGLMGALLGGFVYGLAHGEGACGRCGYPARANHYDFGPIKSFHGILQYHPSGLAPTTAEGR
jgi:hypothetical protein